MSNDFAKFGIVMASVIFYVFATLLVSFLGNGGFDNLEDTAISGWIFGCMLFVVIVLLWATTKCPFFVGQGR